MRWSENETYQFVKIYLSHDCLWNPEHASYKMKEKRQKAYSNFIAEFRSSTGILLNDSELRTKIKNLRSTYTQEVTKIRQRSGPDSTYKPTIKWFADWHKCFKNFSRKRLDDSLFDADQDPTEDSCQKIWVAQDSDNVTENTNSDPFVSQMENDYVLIVKPEPEDSQVKREHTPSSYKVKKKKFKHCSNSELDRTHRSSVDSNPESMAKEDEFDIYGKYIASQLRKMDLQKALRLQLEIQSLVSEARISDISSNQ